MKNRLSIKTVVIFAIVVLSSLLIFGYSLLSARFFSHGVESVILDNMEITVDNYHRSVPEQRRKKVDYFGNYRITTDWEYMPETVKQSFPTPVLPSKQLYITNRPGIFNQSNPNYYVRAVPKGDNVYYVSQWVGFSTPPGILGWNSLENIRYLVVLSCIIGMGIAFALWLITKKLSYPMTTLNFWAKNLDGKTIKKDIPDFHYKELNELASLVRSKIAAEQENLERDQQFVHYASHELRTPITVISQNIEVLKKIMPMASNRADEMKKKAVQRLGRASDNITALIETLLWVNRKTTDDLPEENIRLDELIKEVFENLKYLLEGKKIKTIFETLPTTIKAPEAPLRIVLGNLIRNAFIHTMNGEIIIHQCSNTIIITNENLEHSNTNQLGFGFGLSLTSKLIQKMNWSYQNEPGPRGHKVTVSIDSED